MSKRVLGLIGITCVVMIIVSAVVLLIYGLATAEKAELLQLCWNGTVSQPYDGHNCDEPKEVIWPSIPVKVALDEQDHEEDTFKELDAAVFAFNRQAGLTFFETVQPTKEQVTVVWRAPIAANAQEGGIAIHYWNYELRANILLRDTSNIKLVHRTIMHELGHVAGLQHVENKICLMYPIYYESVDQYQTRLCDANKDLLQSIYRSRR